MAHRYRPGDHALFRFVWPWKIFSVRPTTVVEHTEQRVVLWLAPGTPYKGPPGLRVPIPQIATGRWTTEDARWFGSRLMLAEPSASHSIYVSWGESGEFLGWYVNLEEPWRRSAIGFDTTDHLLDLVVDPDHNWRWKDEDHLSEAVAVGLFTAEKERAIRTEGERVVSRVEARARPFDEGWENWRPEPEWPLPSVPEGWDRLPSA